MIGAKPPFRLLVVVALVALLRQHAVVECRGVARAHHPVAQPQMADLQRLQQRIGRMGVSPVVAFVVSFISRCRGRMQACRGAVEACCIFYGLWITISVRGNG